MKAVRYLGWIHLFHSPILILLPFFCCSSMFKILYINYFLLLMLIYTYTKGECFISLICKKLINNKYVTDSNIFYYPEMQYIFKTSTNVCIYFGITTSLYLYIVYSVLFKKILYYPAAISNLFYFYNIHCKKQQSENQTLFLRFILIGTMVLTSTF
jgi:hypothetical protein